MDLLDLIELMSDENGTEANNDHTENTSADAAESDSAETKKFPAKKAAPSGLSLTDVLVQHEIELTKKVRTQLTEYCRLVWEANERVNLTRHTDFETFVARDVVDVLELSKLIPQDREILDIGSGGGVPGIVLAIIRPDLEVSMCESVGKKAVLLKEFVEKLNLPVVVYHDRAENVLDDVGFDYVTARAVGPMWKLLTWLQGHWPHARRLLALKGPRWVEEVTEAKTRGLTKRLVIKPVTRYPLHSTDPNAELVESFIIEVKPALR